LQRLNRIIKLVRNLFFLSISFYPFSYTEVLPPTSSAKKIEETNPTVSTVDPDNDYIEPESPTGVDALIYDEEENDDDSSHVNTSPRPSVETVEEILPSQQIIRDDYNPLKAKNETIST
jgi:hypothetical protein